MKKRILSLLLTLGLVLGLSLPTYAAEEPDLAEVDQAVKESIRFVIADHVDTVLRTALIEQ